jgi:hypothetical protein
MMPQTDIVSATKKGSPSWIVEEGRERMQRIEARKGKGKGRELATGTKIENGMRGLVIGNEIGSAKEFANENRKGILQGMNMNVPGLGKERKREKEKRKREERRSASAKGRRRGKGNRNESVKRIWNESAKRRKHENAKERGNATGKWRRNGNAIVKKSAKDTAKENGNAIDTSTGSAESERRNATEKEIVQGSTNWSGRKGKKNMPTYPKPKQRIRWETRNCINHRKGSQRKEGKMKAALTTVRIEMGELQERRKD